MVAGPEAKSGRTLTLQHVSEDGLGIMPKLGYVYPTGSLAEQAQMGLIVWP